MSSIVNIPTSQPSDLLASHCGSADINVSEVGRFRAVRFLARVADKRTFREARMVGSNDPFQTLHFAGPDVR